MSVHKVDFQFRPGDVLKLRAMPLRALRLVVTKCQFNWTSQCSWREYLCRMIDDDGVVQLEWFEELELEKVED